MTAFQSTTLKTGRNLGRVSSRSVCVMVFGNSKSHHSPINATSLFSFLRSVYARVQVNEWFAWPWWLMNIVQPVDWKKIEKFLLHLFEWDEILTRNEFNRAWASEPSQNHALKALEHQCWTTFHSDCFLTARPRLSAVPKIRNTICFLFPLELGRRKSLKLVSIELLES